MNRRVRNNTLTSRGCFIIYIQIQQLCSSERHSLCKTRNMPLISQDSKHHVQKANLSTPQWQTKLESVDDEISKRESSEEVDGDEKISSSISGDAEHVNKSSKGPVNGSDSP